VRVGCTLLFALYHQIWHAGHPYCASLPYCELTIATQGREELRRRISIGATAVMDLPTGDSMIAKLAAQKRIEEEAELASKAAAERAADLRGRAHAIRAAGEDGVEESAATKYQQEVVSQQEREQWMERAQVCTAGPSHLVH
jgi:hypothetical protein